MRFVSSSSTSARLLFYESILVRRVPDIYLSSLTSSILGRPSLSPLAHGAARFPPAPNLAPHPHGRAAIRRPLRCPLPCPARCRAAALHRLWPPGHYRGCRASPCPGSACGSPTCCRAADLPKPLHACASLWMNAAAVSHGWVTNMTKVEDVPNYDFATK